MRGLHGPFLAKPHFVPHNQRSVNRRSCIRPLSGKSENDKKNFAIDQVDFYYYYILFIVLFGGGGWINRALPHILFHK